MKSNNELATIRSYKYLSLLKDKNSASYSIYEELLRELKACCEDGKITVVDLLINAFSELGYMEKGLSYNKHEQEILDEKDSILDENGNVLIEDGKYTKYASFFERHDDNSSKGEKYYNGSKQNNDWCSIFFDWLQVTTFGEEEARRITLRPYGKIRGAGVQYASEYYPLGLHLFVNPQSVRMGDQVFFSKNGSLFHTGIVVCQRDGYVYVIEGNTNPQIGKDSRVVPRGKAVCLKRYSLERKDLEFVHPLYELSHSPSEFDSKRIIDLIVKLYEVSKKELEDSLTLEEKNEVISLEHINKKRMILRQLKEVIGTAKYVANTYREEISSTVIKAKGIIK